MKWPDDNDRARYAPAETVAMMAAAEVSEQAEKARQAALARMRTAEDAAYPRTRQGGRGKTELHLVAAYRAAKAEYEAAAATQEAASKAVHAARQMADDAVRDHPEWVAAEAAREAVEAPLRAAAEAARKAAMVAAHQEMLAAAAAKAAALERARRLAPARRLVAFRAATMAVPTHWRRDLGEGWCGPSDDEMIPGGWGHRGTAEGWCVVPQGIPADAALTMRRAWGTIPDLDRREAIEMGVWDAPTSRPPMGHAWDADQTARRDLILEIWSTQIAPDLVAEVEAELRVAAPGGLRAGEDGE